MPCFQVRRVYQQDKDLYKKKGLSMIKLSSNHATLQRLTLMTLPCLFLLSACGSDDDDSTTTTITTTTSTLASRASDNDDTNAFPLDAMVASPTDTSDTPAAKLIPHARATTASTRATTANGSAYAAAADSINDVLMATTALSASTFDPDLFYTRDQDAACYGPALYYKNHPDGASATSAQLPTGDLGMWTEKEGSTNEACASAQLNARLGGVKDRTYISWMTIASIIQSYETTGKNWPADVTAGSSVTLTTELNALGVANTTFSSATMALALDGKTWTYHLTFEYTRSGTPYTVTVDVKHQTGSTASQYEGLLSYAVEDTFMGGNCGMGMSSNAITYYGSLHYIKDNASEMSFQSRGVQTCGHGTTSALTASLSSTAISGMVVDPNASWSDNFSIFTASFDPTSITGNYTYAWQAGRNDSHARVFNLGMETTTVGEAYFGFGDSLQTSQTGEIKGIICNWAGPGNHHATYLQPYAQRQHLTYNTTTEYFEPTNSAASDITYAPTNNCEYDGLGSFGYGTTSGNENTPSAAVTKDLLTTSTGTTTYSTITERIDNRGFNLPSYP